MGRVKEKLLVTETLLFWCCLGPEQFQIDKILDKLNLVYCGSMKALFYIVYYNTTTEKDKKGIKTLKCANYSSEF